MKQAGNRRIPKAFAVEGAARYARWMVATMLVAALAACSPGADFSYADGAPGRYDEWQGRWVFVNYWAEWCAPCRHEIPELNELHAARADSDAMVVASLLIGEGWLVARSSFFIWITRESRKPGSTEGYASEEKR
jgi:hypothetical protein